MKIHEMYAELLEVTRTVGIPVRKEKGNFKSGHCVVNDKEIFILNKSTPVETLATIIAQGLASHAENIHLKPVVRDFIEKEIRTLSLKNNFNLDVKY